MKIVSVIGTRPQLIKAAALLPTLCVRHRHVFVDTGQHWDERMAGTFFKELDLPQPDHQLGIGGGGHAGQTGRMLVALEPVLKAERRDAVLVYGDTNSTLAGSLAAAKLGIPVAHVEAGLRSFDRRMPEEINRVVADHLATWCLAPTPAGVANLAAEGITAGVLETGDLMQDLAARVAAEVRGFDALLQAGIALAAAGAPDLAARLRPGGFVFVTIHRAENREQRALVAWTMILGDAARADRPVILALHPGTRVALETAGVALPPGVHVVEPLGYRTSLTLQLHAAVDEPNRQSPASECLNQEIQSVLVLGEQQEPSRLVAQYALVGQLLLLGSQLRLFAGGHDLVRSRDEFLKLAVQNQRRIRRQHVRHESASVLPDRRREWNVVACQSPLHG